MKNKYILYFDSSNGIENLEFVHFDEAEEAYENCNSQIKFLYQPDKTYFVGTLSSTGYKVGHDHLYHKDTAKCTGLFIAKNKNQIAKFLEKVNWHHQGASESSKARLYGNKGYGFLYKDDNDEFEYHLAQYYLSSFNIQFPSMIESGFGAIDIENYKSKGNPFRMR